jgi:hypothetical protein
VPETLDRRLVAVMFADMVGWAAPLARAIEAGGRLTIAEALALATS